MIIEDQNYIFAISQRQDKNMSFIYGQTNDSLLNRKLFLERIGIDFKQLVCAKQIHASSVYLVEEKDRGRGALLFQQAIDGTDALITQVRRLPLAVFTADCLSVFLFDPHGPTIGLVHAGWRGTKDEITKRTVLFMKHHFKINPADLQVIFGPVIRSCCFQVKDEFKKYFSYGVVEKDNGIFLDLPRINLEQLLVLGVKKENIRDINECTFCSSEKYFSFRREGNLCGRMISVAMLK